MGNIKLVGYFLYKQKGAFYCGRKSEMTVAIFVNQIEQGNKGNSEELMGNQGSKISINRSVVKKIL